MNVLGKAVGFSLFLTLIFTLVTHLLPQVEGEAPVEKKIDLAALTMDDFIAMGEDLFNNKGTCTLCHKPPPIGRAPDVQGLDMVATSSERMQDERYKGIATDAESYLRESMVDPGIYVVAGWGKKGTNDTESPMPAIHKAPIELSDVEIDAIIAYLQAKDDNEVTVELPTEVPAAVADTSAVAGSAPLPAATPEEAIKKYGCLACHAMMGSEAALGPALTDTGARLSVDEIRQSIINPAAVIAEGFPAGVMPADFAAKMTVKELEMIVSLLVEQTGDSRK